MIEDSDHLFLLNRYRCSSGLLCPRTGEVIIMIIVEYHESMTLPIRYTNLFPTYMIQIHYIHNPLSSVSTNYTTLQSAQLLT